MSKNVLFLVGAGRSGTSLLYKLLSLHQDIAYISNYSNLKQFWWMGAGLSSLFAGNPRLNKKFWFKSDGNAYFLHRPWLNKLIPTPVEGEVVYQSAGVPLFPATDYHASEDTKKRLPRSFEQYRKVGRGKVLVTKRTGNNRRIHLMNEIFPEAKFIHIIRDGRDVTQSLSNVRWWEDHPIWWDEQKRKAIDIEKAGRPRLDICATNWVKEMEALDANLKPISQDRIIEVRYEDLLTDPLLVLGKILEFAGLNSNSEYDEVIKSLGIKSKTPRWKTDWTQDELNLVTEIQKEWLSRIGVL